MESAECAEGLWMRSAEARAHAPRKKNFVLISESLHANVRADRDGCLLMAAARQPLGVGTCRQGRRLRLQSPRVLERALLKSAECAEGLWMRSASSSGCSLEEELVLIFRRACTRRSMQNAIR